MDGLGVETVPPVYAKESEAAAGSDTDEGVSTASSLHRNFFDRYDSAAPYPADGVRRAGGGAAVARMEALMSFLSSDVLGGDAVVDSPFGPRPMLYADYAASGRALRHVESFLSSEVLPYYGNTHSSSAYSGLQTSLYRREARDIIGRCCGAGKDDVVLFAGTGSTGAMRLLLGVLTQRWREAGAGADDVALFVGPYQHHSVLLPLRELGFTLRDIDEDLERGGVDLLHLRRELTAFAHRRFRVAFFTAASNVNGILTDAQAVSALCVELGCVNVWDYAAAAPYTDIDMNPRRQAALAKDALLLSPHKLLGGVSTPGVLVVKKHLLLTATPTTPGGGTVFFVSPHHHRYLENFEEREEGGTPDIVGAIRAGLAFHLRAAVDSAWRTERLERHTRALMARLQAESAVVLMGHASASRLPVFSFLIAHQPSGLYLHPTFVSALLNDLFGVQSRSGCMCAGPYAHLCLGLSVSAATALEAALMRRMEIARPGFTRLSLHYSMTDADVEFLSDAVVFVARNGWQLLPLYGFHADSGEWKHRSRMSRTRERRWLAALDYSVGAPRFQYGPEQHKNGALPDQPLAELRRSMLLAASDAALSAASNATVVDAATDDRYGGLAEDCRHLRWFLLPAEALLCMREPHRAAELRPAVHILQPPRSTAEMRAVQSAWRSDDGQREAPSSEINAGHNASTIPSSSTVLPTAASSELESLRAGEDDRRHQREKRAAARRMAHGAANGCNKAASQAPLASSSTCPAPPSASAPAVSHNGWPPAASRPPAVGGVCRFCFHRHLASPQQSQCTSCACVSFEELPSSPSSTASVALVSREVASLSTKLRSLVGRAILEFGMIGEGDRVLVGVSGGKDSLTLVHVLLQLQARSPVKFELGAVTVDPQTPEYDPSPLRAYFAQLGLPYHYESQPIIAQARACMRGSKQSICAFCARMKRGLLYSALRRERWNVLALGQHADDLCESLLMSAFHNGRLRTMKANYRIGAGDLRVIRPLVYVRERLTRRFAQLSDLPVIFENCVAEGTLVALADGTSVPVEDVQVGADVLGYHAALGPGETEGLIARQVHAVLDRGVRECVELLFGDGRTLVCTPDHRIRTADCRWVTAGKLVVATDEVAVAVEYPNATDGAEGNDEHDDIHQSTDEITCAVHYDAKVLPLFRLLLVGRRQVGVRRVYDLSVPSAQGEESRSFVAAGIVVHNCPACFAPPKERARVKEIVAAQESRHPNVVSNLLRAMRPLMDVRTATQQGQQRALAEAGEQQHGAGRGHDDDEEDEPL